VVLSVFFPGLLFGMALILPQGPQNAFVMNQGMSRHYHLMTAGLCTLSDVILIYAGIFGGSALLTQSPLLVSWGGVLFLLWYGWGGLSIALNGNVALTADETMKQGRWRIIVAILAVTWLNPHVYIDTFVVLGSLGGQLPVASRGWFALGSVSASLLWFFGLALLTSWLSPRLKAPTAQRIINLLVGLVMWGIAGKLALQAVGYP